MKVSKSLKNIYVIAILESILLLLLKGVMDAGDTPSYVRAWDVILSGNIDNFRTPVYPCYLGFFKVVFGENHYQLAAAIGQHVCFWVSIWYFASICQRFTSSQKLTWWLTLVYAAYPGLLYYCSILLTDIFGLVGMVFLIYAIMKLYDCYTLPRAIWVSIILTTLLLLRPIMVFLLPIFLVAWLFAMCQSGKKRQAIVGIVTTILASSVYLSYMFAFRQTYGVFSTSTVGVYNRWVIARKYGMIRAEDIRDSILRTDVKNSVDKTYFWNVDSMVHYFQKYDLKTLDATLDESFRMHSGEYLKSIGQRVIESSSENFVDPQDTLMKSVLSVFDILGLRLRLSVVYLVIFIYSVVLFVWIWSRRGIPWMSGLLYMIGVSNLIVALIGAQDSWFRLVMPSLPFYLLFAGQLCCLFNRKPISQLNMV